MIYSVQTSMLRVVVRYKKTETLATRGSSVHCEVPVPCDIMSLPGSSFKYKGNLMKVQNILCYNLCNRVECIVVQSDKKTIVGTVMRLSPQIVTQAVKHYYS